MIKLLKFIKTLPAIIEHIQHRLDVLEQVPIKQKSEDRIFIDNVPTSQLSYVRSLLEKKGDK